MIRVLGGLLTLLLATPLLFAQCDQCPQEEGFTADYCYVTEVLPGKCAQFSLGDDHFLYHVKAGKPGIRIPLPENPDISYLLSLSEYKLKKAEDLLFLREALVEWQGKSMQIKIQKVAESRFTAEELGQMTFETMESGLGVRVLEEGSGLLPENGKKVKVHYRGYLADGNVFDASYDRGTPFEFPLGMGRVIKGWDEGLGLLPVGSRFILQIPPDLGYGARPVGSIPPNSTLFFDVFILDSN